MLFEAGYFRGRPFDFFWGGGEGGIGDLGKKYPADWFQGEKNLARKYLGEKNSCTEKHLSHCVQYWKKKSYTVVCQGRNSISRGLGEKFLPDHPYPPSPPQKSNGQPLSFFFSFSSCSVCLIVLIYGLKDPFPLHKYLPQRQSCSWQYNNSYCWHQRWYKRGGLICMGCYGWFIVLVG